jgi:putative flippase GtrA
MNVALRQLVRYGIVGLASNGFLFLLYLAMTHAGLGPKVAMTIAYVTGLAQTFFFNRRWTFEHRGAAGAALARYIATYGVGYALNLAALALLVDRAGLPHAPVQAAMILCIAGQVFLMQKFWVFRSVAAAPHIAPAE